MQLSNKQKEFWNNCNSRWNIKTGATRSGKTYLDYFIIPKRIRETKGQGHIVLLGNTSGTIERNVLDPLREIYGNHLVGQVSSKNKVNIFGKQAYALGADKKNRVSIIQGAGIEYAYGDEITTWAEEVFQMLKSRLDKPNSKFDGTCNPDHPNHWFKKFLDSDADIYHQHYSLDDNPFTPDNFKTELKKEYKGTVFYKRFIDGLWVAAEGIIYRRFADNPNKYIIDKAPSIAFATIGVDYGGSGSGHSFQCTGFTPGIKEVITLDEYYTKKELDPEQLNKLFVDFVKIQLSKYNVVEIFADSAEQVLIRGMRNALAKENIGVPIRNAIKGPIVDRIRFYTLIMGAGKYKVLNHCKVTINAFESALWNSKKLHDERLDDGTTNIDTLDAQEYSTEKYQKQIIDRMMLGR